MEPHEVEAALADAELVPCLQAPLPDAKELREACLAADIPVLLDRAACCGKSGCGCAPKVELYARSDDVPKITRLLEDRWRALAVREGTVDADHPSVARPPAVEGAFAPCPACGTAAALVDGACSDCGLQLE